MSIIKGIRSVVIPQNFAEISAVEITTDDCPYHISTPYAADLRAVYHLKGSALIVCVQHSMGTYSDSFGGGDFSYWQLGFYWETIPRKQLVELSFNREKHAKCMFDDNYFDLPVIGHNRPINVPNGFHVAGSGGKFHLEMLPSIEKTIVEAIYDKYGHNTGVNKRVVNPAVWSLLKGAIESVTSQLHPILARNFTSESGIEPYHFAPLYTFKDCEAAFMSRFDMKYFRAIVPQRRRDKINRI